MPFIELRSPGREALDIIVLLESVAYLVPAPVRPGVVGTRITFQAGTSLVVLNPFEEILEAIEEIRSQGPGLSNQFLRARAQIRRP